MNGDVAFMVPYWISLLIFGVCTVIAWAAAVSAWETKRPRRVQKTQHAIAVIMSVVVLVALAYGIWAPFFISGLY